MRSTMWSFVSLLLLLTSSAHVEGSNLCSEGCNNCTKTGEGHCDPFQCGAHYVYNRQSAECDACAEGCLVCTLAGSCDPGQCDAGYDYAEQACESCARHCRYCTTVGPGLCDYNACEAGFFYDPPTQTCNRTPGGG